MAKKSARSKGYRKYHQETKGYTPQEKKIMTIGFAVIAIVLICVLWLPDFIESFSLLKVKDGVVQNVGDNWLLANVGTSSKAKYRKLAEFDGVELSQSKMLSNVGQSYSVDLKAFGIIPFTTVNLNPRKR